MKYSCLFYLLFVGINFSFAQDFNSVGFSFIGEFQDHHFFLSRDSLTYEEAQQQAVELGGYLLSINSDNENNFIQSNITENVFIGYQSINGTPIWDNDSPVYFTNFDTTSLNTEGNVIMSVETGQWLYTNPQAVAKYIIEFDENFNNCNVSIEGEVLCSEKLDDGTLQVYSIDNEQTIIKNLFDSTGSLISSINEGTFIKAGVFVENDEIYCRDEDGNIKWVKPIPSHIYYDITHATTFPNGDMMLAGIQYDYNNSTSSSISSDSLILIKTDSLFNVQNVISQFHHGGIHTHAQYLYLDEIIDLSTTSDSTFTVVYNSSDLSPAPSPNLRHHIATYNSDLTVVNSNTIYSFVTNYLKTPCGDYRVKTRLSDISAMGNGYSDYYTTWKDNATAGAHKTYRYRSISGWASYGGYELDFYGQNPYFSTGYEWNNDPNAENESFFGFYSNNGLVFNQLPIIRFNYVEIIDNDALYFYIQDGVQQVVLASCIEHQSCEMEVEFEVICDDNNTPDTHLDDVHKYNINVKGDPIVWSTQLDFNEFKGICNTPITMPGIYSLNDTIQELTFTDEYRNDCSALSEPIIFKGCSYELPDLEIIDVQTYIDTSYYQGIFPVDFAIANNGFVRSMDSIHITYELYSSSVSIFQYEETIFVDLEPGASISLERQILFQNYITGLRALRITLDADNKVEEIDECNNETSTSQIQMLNPFTIPDYALTALEVNSYQVNQGKSIDILLDAHNFKYANGINTVEIGYTFLRTNEESPTDYQVVDQIELTNNEDITDIDLTVNVPIDLPIGYYYLVLKIDPYQEIYEYSESNNKVYKYIEVIDKDIFIASPDAPVILDSLTNIPQLQTVQLSPNPATTNIQINFSSEHKTNSNIKIVDSTGKLVLQQNIQIVTGQNQLDVVIEHLPKGIYFLQLANSDSVHSFTKPD